MFPTIPTAGANTLLTSSQSTATTTHTFPSLTTLAQSAGDLMIAIIVCYQGGSVNAEFSSWGGGFTEFVDQSANSTTIQSIGAAYKFATGSETGTFTVTSVASTRSAMFLITIPGAHPSTPPEATAKANGTTAAADPGALNPGAWAAEDTLWIAVAVSGETSTTSTYTGLASAPANYGNYADTGIIGGDLVGAVEGALAFRQLNAASEDVAGFGVDTTNAGNSALLVAVRPKEVFSLVVADALHAHAADNLVLTQVHTLAIADAGQNHTVDNAVLTQVHVLTVADAVQAHAADNLVLVQVPTLVVADASHGHTADNLVLEEQSGATNLVIADATHAHAVDNVVLTQAHSLSVADAAHAHTADATVLTQAHNLAVADATQAHAADNLVLTQVHQLVIQDATQAQTAEECQVNSATQLVIQDTVHGHAADALVLTQVHNLTVADAVQSHTADGLDLTQLHELVIDDASHSHGADFLNLGSSDEIDLVIADALHQHTAQALKLTTHLVPAPGVSTRAAAVAHLGRAAGVSSTPGSRSRVTQRSGAAWPTSATTSQ